MVTRVTSQTMQRNAINNIFRITEDLFKVQNKIATGKRILTPSDDPSGMSDVLSLKTSIAQTRQFSRNIDNNKIFLQRTDSELNSVGLGLNRAKELAISELGGTSTATTRQFTSYEIDQIISSVIQAGNTQVKNQYIFSGTKTRTEPFQISASSAVYLGNTEKFVMEIADGININLTLPGSDVLGADLNPVINTTTSLSDLNGATGIAAGTFNITDRSGTSANITLSSSGPIADVISAINSASVNITASSNSATDGISLTDTNSVITQALVVTEVSGGSTASGLGILGSRNGNLEGTDLDPGLSSLTKISELNGGSGLTLGDISIINGSASGTVSLSSASTIGDVLTLINNSGFNVTASINSAGNALRIDSNNSSTVAVVNDVGTGTVAEQLGLGGGRNSINTLIKLKQALEQDDTEAILASLINLDSGMETIQEARAITGGILNRVDSNDFFHDRGIIDQTEQISNIEDADLIQSASDLAAFEIALQASLDSTARIIQPSLLNFLS